MSEHLVFTVTSVEACERVVDSLRAEGVEDEAISVIGQASADLSHLPDGGTLENDTVPAVQRGAALGGTAGLLAGLTAVTVAPGLMVAGAAIALAAAGGASIGALGSALAGASVPNSRLRQYQEAIDNGQLVLIVEVREKSVDELRAGLLKRHPELAFEGTLDSIPPAV